ncbi:MAG: hypothetical protein JXJ04_04405 [Spirochaetales bacterium]|nr:hypothetical protein [Spirochaetales bacterium]
MEPIVIKKEEDNSVYFIIHWSRIKKADKYDIIKHVPSVPGIFELYYLDYKKKLNLFFLSRAWYGGLRNSLRERTDPELEKDPNRRKILEDYDCYYRYTISQSFGDMSDILFFFESTYSPHNPQKDSSGRYEFIYVEEKSDDKIVTI